MEHWEWTRAADVDGGAIFESSMRGVRQDSPLTALGWPALRPRRVGWDLPPQEAPFGRRAAGCAGSRRCPAGRRKTDHGSGCGTACPTTGQQVRATGFGLRRDPGCTDAGTTPAGPRIGLAATSVTAGHLPTGCSPGSTAPCRAALEGRPATTGADVFGRKPRGSASPQASSEAGRWRCRPSHRARQRSGGFVPAGTKASASPHSTVREDPPIQETGPGKVTTGRGKGQRPAAVWRAPRAPLRW